MKKNIFFSVILIILFNVITLVLQNSERGLASQSIKTLQVNGENLRIMQVGNGRDLLFVHGTPGSLEDWLPVIPTLSREYRLSLFDRPGNGASSRSAKSNLDYNAKIVVDLIHELSLRDVTVVGHSYGGSIALKLAADRTPSVSSVVLIGTPAFDHEKPGFSYTLSTLPLIGTLFNCCVARFFAPAVMKKAIQRMFYGDIPSGFVEFRTKLWSRPKQLKSHAQEFLALGEDLRSMTPKLKNISVPTLIIAGDNDEAKILDDAKKLHEIIPRSHMKILPHSGHYVQFEQTEALVKLISEFKQ